MSNALQAAIGELEGELEAIDQKRSDIEHTLTVMRRLIGEGVTTNGTRRAAKRSTHARTHARTQGEGQRNGSKEPP